MNLKPHLAAAAALCLLGAGLTACAKAEPAAPAGAWSVVTTPPAQNLVQARRTVDLAGGGQLAMQLSCNYRPSNDPTMNGFWLKVELELKSDDGNLGLDSLKTDGESVYFTGIRSTGETGAMMFAIIDATHYVFENNQTNTLNQDNNDPDAVELASTFDMPLSDGRTVSIDMRKSDPGYQSLLTSCKALAPAQSSATN